MKSLAMHVLRVSKQNETHFRLFLRPPCGVMRGRGAGRAMVPIPFVHDDRVSLLFELPRLHVR